MHAGRGRIAGSLRAEPGGGGGDSARFALKTHELMTGAEVTSQRRL